MTSSKMMNVKPWFHKLLLLCQICGVQGVKENIQPGVPWDLHIVVIVMALAVIGVWEPLKHCVGGRQVRVQILKVTVRLSKVLREEYKEQAKRAPAAYVYLPTGLVGYAEGSPHGAI